MKTILMRSIAASMLAVCLSTHASESQVYPETTIELKNAASSPVNKAFRSNSALVDSMGEVLNGRYEVTVSVDADAANALIINEQSTNPGESTTFNYDFASTAGHLEFEVRPTAPNIEGVSNYTISVNVPPLLEFSFTGQGDGYTVYWINEQQYVFIGERNAGIHTPVSGDANSLRNGYRLNGYGDNILLNVPLGSGELVTWGRELYDFNDLTYQPNNPVSAIAYHGETDNYYAVDNSRQRNKYCSSWGKALDNVHIVSGFVGNANRYTVAPCQDSYCNGTDLYVENLSSGETKAYKEIGGVMAETPNGKAFWIQSGNGMAGILKWLTTFDPATEEVKTYDLSFSWASSGVTSKNGQHYISTGAIIYKFSEDLSSYQSVDIRDFQNLTTSSRALSFNGVNRLMLQPWDKEEHVLIFNTELLFKDVESLPLEPKLRQTKTAQIQNKKWEWEDCVPIDLETEKTPIDKATRGNSKIWNMIAY